MGHLRSPFLDRLVLVGVIVGNAIAWAIPSNVAKLVAREQDVLLGRYSRAHFSWLVVAGVLSLILVFLHFTPNATVKRRRVFGVLAFVLGLIPALIVVDLAMRLRTDYPYKTDRYVYHRPPKAAYRLPYEDAPAVKRSFPTTPPGFERVECVMSYDAEGFRNASDLKSCDIVAIGDSFTEGSRVSDDQPWPVQLARMSGLTVCNLGMSGYGPPEYLAAVEHYGLSKKPKFVICMMYEGNDFRSSTMTAKSGITFTQAVATSPLVVRANSFFRERLGAIGATWALNDAALAWLPLRVPDRDGGRYYAFAAKQLTDLAITKEKLETKGSWYVATEILKKMRASCEKAGAKLVVAYAPSKAHVVFPLAAPRLTAEPVRDYMLYKKKPLDLPEGEEFLSDLLARIPNEEEMVREWCERRSVPFVSLTPALRADVSAGRQPFYTYDQHWTPQGHEAAARTIHSYLSTSLRVATAPE